MKINMPPKEEFEMKCKELGYNTVKIGECYGICQGTVYKLMKEYKIKTRRQIFKEKKPIREELEIKCEESGYNATKIREYYGISSKTALRWMKGYDIKTNKSTHQISKEKKPSKEELEAKCKEFDHNTTKVGEYYGITRTTALNWMKGYKIKIGKKRSREELGEICERFEYDVAKVGKYCGVSRSTAFRWMGEYNIKTKGQISKKRKIPKEEFKEVCKKVGYNSVKVAEYYNIGLSTAWKWMKKEGIINMRKYRTGSIEQFVRIYVGK